MPTLLVIDGEPTILDEFQRRFQNQELSILTAKTAAEGVEAVRAQRPQVVVLSDRLPDQKGLEVFRQIRAIDRKVPVIFTIRGNSGETAIEAIKLGALDYLIKPLDFEKAKRLVDRALEIGRLMHEPAAAVPATTSVPATGGVLLGRCESMQEVYKAIGRVAAQNVTVLIRGESGTGKELVARALHHHSDRSASPFMAVNCAAIPETLLESELFGHEKGSFTGADRRRIGKFEQASGGTLFLDEIGDMSPPLQSKMLRVLQEQRFERIGGNETIETDVRIIAATNRDLETMVAAGQFRTDLYYRLNGYTIKLPPLRNRSEDLPLLIDHILVRANRELGRDVQRLAPEAIAVLQNYPWPGNIRELQSVLRQAVLQTAGPALLADFLPESVRSMSPHASSASPPVADPLDQFVDLRLKAGTNKLYDETLARMERQLITRVLRDTLGNQADAAEILGITRTTLRTKMRQLGISVDRIVQSDTKPMNNSSG